MHPARHGTHAGYELRPPARGPAEGVEEAHFDVRVKVHRGCAEVLVGHIHVIHQQAHPNAAVCGHEQHMAEQPSDQIIMVKVILHIQTALGLLRQDRPCHERISAVGQQMKTRFARMCALLFRNGPAERCVSGVF